MTLKIRITFLAILLFTCSSQKLIAQTAKQTDYYIEIKNVDTKALSKEVETLIKSKSEVVFFSGYKLPVAFYVLKSNQKINKETFSSWIKPLNLEVLVFEEKVLTPSMILSKKEGKSNIEKETKSKSTKITPKF
jgi:hypothetical protein